MEGNLNFSLPEERSEFQVAINAHKWHNVAWEMHRWLRSETKHADRSPRVDVLLEAQEQLWEILRNEGLNLFED